MSTAFLASYVALWVVVIALGVLVASLMRLIGALHQRIGPSGAAVIDPGPDIGESVAQLLDDAGIPRDSTDLDTMLVFVSADCGACDELVPSLVPFASRVRGRVRVATIDLTPGSAGGARAFQARHKEAVALDIRRLPDLARAMKIDSTPFAVWIDGHGKVVSKGVVNHAEHLESLENARRLGFATLNEYAADARRRANAQHDTLSRGGARV